MDSLIDITLREDEKSKRPSNGVFNFRIQLFFCCMKIKIYLLFILFVVSCSGKKNNPISHQTSSANEKHETDSSIIEAEEVTERNLQNEFPDYSTILVTKGKFDSDQLTDYFYILHPDTESKENRLASRCVLILGNKKKKEQRVILFDDLLPIATMSGKIDEPFETVRLSSDTLFACFVSSAYGHDEFYKECYTFKFNTEGSFFSLIHYEYEFCMLPDCEETAFIAINEDELVNSQLPFSFKNWLMSGGCFSTDNRSISEKNRSNWKRFSTTLKQMGVEYQSKKIEDELF